MSNKYLEQMRGGRIPMSYEAEQVAWAMEITKYSDIFEAAARRVVFEVDDFYFNFRICREQITVEFTRTETSSPTAEDLVKCIQMNKIEPLRIEGVVFSVSTMDKKLQIDGQSVMNRRNVKRLHKWLGDNYNVK